VIIKSTQYPAFLDHFMKIFLKILQEGEPHFIAEYNIQVGRTVPPQSVTLAPHKGTL
jgi:transformation/transcription domain-associated protein